MLSELDTEMPRCTPSALKAVHIWANCKTSPSFAKQDCYVCGQGWFFFLGCKLMHDSECTQILREKIVFLTRSSDLFWDSTQHMEVVSYSSIIEQVNNTAPLDEIQVDKHSAVHMTRTCWQALWSLESALQYLVREVLLLPVGVWRQILAFPQRFRSLSKRFSWLVTGVDI